MLDANLIGSAQPLDWIVVYIDKRGFAQQLIVRGEALPGVSMDGDAKATNLRLSHAINTVLSNRRFCELNSVHYRPAISK